MNFSSLTKTFQDKKTIYFSWIEQATICLAVLVSYASVWPNEFVFDDTALIVKNAVLLHWKNIPDIFTTRGWLGMSYRPVPTLVYFCIYQAFGASTSAFHALNITLHVINACLLHHFGVRSGFKKGTAFIAALVWAVHPLHTEAVSYMGATPELLWGTFSLLGLTTLLPDFSPQRIWRAVPFFILALGSKESAVVFPALAAITFFLVNKERTQFSAYLKMWPFWVVSAIYIAALLMSMHKGGYYIGSIYDGSLSEDYAANYTNNVLNRIFTCLATLTVYARLIIWPTGLHWDRNFSIFSTLMGQPALGAFVVLLGLLQILWGKARRGLALSFGLLWFAIALSPVTGIALPANALLSEHWLYVPMMGLLLGVAQTLEGLFEKRKDMKCLIICVIVFSLSTVTFLQNEKWRTPETLLQNAIQSGEKAANYRDYLGGYYLERGEFDKAAEQYRYEISHPDGRSLFFYAEPHWRLATALLHVPIKDDEIPSTEDVLRALPNSPHIPEAIRELAQALQVYPNYDRAVLFLSAISRYQSNAPAESSESGAHSK